MSWAEFVALCGSVGFGLMSAVVPLANAEAYVVTSQMVTTAAVPVALATAIGQSFGKLMLFLAVRQGKKIPERHARYRPARRAYGPTRSRTIQLTRQLLGLIGTKRWGMPIVFAAAAVGLPPVYAVSLLAGATSMRASLFFVTVLVGRILRFVLLALGVGGVVMLWA